MGKVSIKVVIAGRTYPLSVNENEQERVLKAAEDINNSIKLLQKNYAVRDMQDLLAMTALQLASKSDKGGSTASSPDFSGLERSLSELIAELKN